MPEDPTREVMPICFDHEQRISRLEGSAEAALKAIPRIHERLDHMTGKVYMITGGAIVVGAVSGAVIASLLVG